MFENATRLQFRPGEMQEGLKILRTYIVPILRRQDGLISLALIPNRQSHQIIVLSIWETPAYARVVEAEKEYCEAIHRLDAYLIEIPTPPTQPSLTASRASGWSYN